MERRYSWNIPLLYIYSVLIKRVTMPIITMYFLLNNLSYTQIGILASVMSILMMVTEIPGGIFADRHGKKSSLLLHSFFGLLTMFFYFIGNSFWHFLVASVFYGIAGAFISGTRNAILYDTLKEIGETDKFKKYNGRKVLYSYIFNAAVLLVIPVIYSQGPKLPFLIGMGFYIVSLITASLFKEPPFTDRSEEKVSGYSKQAFKSLGEIFSEPKLVSAVSLMMVALGFVWMSSEYIQPLMKISGLKVVYFGIVYSLMRVFTGLGAETTHRLESFLKPENVLYLGLGLLVLSFIGMSAGMGLITVGAIIFLNLSYGINRNILQDVLNRNTGSENRTTVLSISSLLSNLFKILIVFGSGVLADIVGVKAMFGYATAVLVILLTAALSYRKSIHGTGKKQKEQYEKK